MSAPLLLNPGPVTLSARVRAALAQPDLCHREPEFFALQDEIRTRLLGVYGLSNTEWVAVLLGGSGTAAVEAMVASLVPTNSRLLVLENGVYGERIHHIAEIYGVAVEAQHHEWGAALDLAALDARLADATQPGITHVAVIHHETTTGRLNPLAEISRICAGHGVALLADTVSSFGGEVIDFSAGSNTGGLVAAAGTANKCLHGVPGVAFVVVRRAALAQATVRSLYFDLKNWCDKQDAQGTPYTPPVHAFYGLCEALREFAEAGGVAARHARYRALADQVAAGCAHLGIREYLPRSAASAVLRSYHLPDGIGYDALHDALKRAGFVIYAGQGGLAKHIFRISTMGALTAADMERLVQAMAALVAQR
ncbi:MAG: 2-aminoethylphosphonate aminotransferase [Nevskiaceae bacterium]|nr:MAG: 2-aminoethylphosphonate aminotransferase [Nevskiaceae bacterium]TBR73555.1 MAG: 2-aminoethylphosphonate aminotransferase [Nevskiaceae bacterium]